MTDLEAIYSRHSVRRYRKKEIKNQDAIYLNKLIQIINEQSGLNIQLVLNEPKAFNSLKAHYGNFEDVTNYIALVGKKGKENEIKCGYYGEKLVLEAIKLGLNACWVALTFKKVKSAFVVNKDEKLFIVIALGYGMNEGVSHKIKGFDEVSLKKRDFPEWYKRGVEAALLAPTAMNQQKFMFDLVNGNEVVLTTKKGFYVNIDLGIVKYHFEVGAGKENFVWKE